MMYGWEMNGWMNACKHEWMDGGWVDAWVVWKIEPMQTKIDRRMAGWVDGFMMAGWLASCLTGWMNG